MTSRKIHLFQLRFLLLNNNYRRFKSFFQTTAFGIQVYIFACSEIISFVLYNRLGHKSYEINCFVDMLHVGFEILCKSLLTTNINNIKSIKVSSFFQLWVENIM